MSIDTMSFMLGGLFIAVGLLGGGIEIRELKVPAVGPIGRVLCFVVGVVFVGLTLFLNFNEPDYSTAPDVNTLNTENQDKPNGGE